MPLVCWPPYGTSNIFFSARQPASHSCHLFKTALWVYLNGVMIQSPEQPDSCPQPANGREHTQTLCLLSNLYTWVTQCGSTHKHTASMTSSLSTPCNWERSSLHPHSDTPLNPLLYYILISKHLCYPQRVTLAVYPCTAVYVVILILKTGSIKWVYEREREGGGSERERERERGVVWCVERQEQ